MTDIALDMRHHKRPFADYQPRHFLWSVSADGKVGTVTLNRPERKNPLTFDSYAELRDFFRGLCYASDIKTVVVTGAGGNFCSGGDVHEIIGPLTRMRMPELLEFTRMTGDRQGHAGLPAAGHQCHRRHLCRGRRDDGAGFRHAPGHRGGQDCLPVRAGGRPAPTWERARCRRA